MSNGGLLDGAPVRQLPFSGDDGVNQVGGQGRRGGAVHSDDMARSYPERSFEFALDAALFDLRGAMLAAHAVANAQRLVEVHVGNGSLRQSVLRVDLGAVGAPVMEAEATPLGRSRPERPGETHVDTSERGGVGGSSLNPRPPFGRAVSPFARASVLLESEPPPPPPTSAVAAERPTPAPTPARREDLHATASEPNEVQPAAPAAEDMRAPTKLPSSGSDESGPSQADPRARARLVRPTHPQAATVSAPREPMSMAEAGQPLMEPSADVGNSNMDSGIFASNAPFFPDEYGGNLDCRRSSVPSYNKKEASKLLSVIEVAGESGKLRQKKNKVKGFGNIVSIGILGNRNRKLSLVLDLVLGIVITLNAAALGLSLDWEPNWPGWQTVDASFAVVFLLEVLAKLYILGPKEYVVGESRWWHLYDVLMVLFSGLDLVLNATQPTDDYGGGSVAAMRVVRLGRVARLLRVLKLPFLSELMMMINGAIGGLRTLLCAQLLLAVPLYGLAVTLRELLGPYSDVGLGAECFSSMGDSFLTCFRCFVTGDCTTMEGVSIFLALHVNYGVGFTMVYCVATVLMTFGLFNVIAAIFVDNILAAAKFNEIRMQQHRLANQKLFAEKALQLVEMIYAEAMFEQSGTHTQLNPSSTSTELCTNLMKIRVSPALFRKVFTLPEVVEVLKDLDISDEDHVDLFETLDIDGSGSIDLEELIAGISKLRGDARRSDIVSVGLMMRHMQASVEALDRGMRRQHRVTTQQLSSTLPRGITHTSLAGGFGTRASDSDGNRLPVDRQSVEGRQEHPQQEAHAAE